jgi:iron complex outermembrane receptor protein
MKKIKQLLSLALMVCTLSVAAQSTITGTVVDGGQQAPLPGATIVEKGTSNGVSSDFDGNFTITSSSSTGEITISYVGYVTTTISFSGNMDLGSVSLEASELGLEEVQLFASVAVDRKTPVAVSTIKAADIELKLGTQEFPEILKSTPGVYATKSGGGYGDGRINLRGFSSENVGVLINGIPVNDMENGRLYWSNWAGLGDVTSSMQVQRGLGASRVAVPSIGGTINIVTKTTDVEAGGSVRMGTANDGYQKYGMTYSTGLMDNGFAATVSLAKIFGDGYVDGTEFDGFNYFVNLSKQINDNHKLSFTAFGAKQTHGQRYNRRTIAQNRATEQGGKRFNPDWGIRNGEVEHLSYNFYHKPQISLNHYWDVNDNTSVSTALYASFGNGGGRRQRGSKFYDDSYRLGDVDQPIDFDQIAQENKDRGALGSSDIFAASRNSHNWYGLLSTLKTNLSDDLVLSGGIDARYYVGSHWYEVADLLGGQFYINESDDENTFGQALKVGDRFNKDYDGKVVRGGLFAQAEYSPSTDLSIFVATAVSNTTYSKEEFMYYAPTDPARESDKVDFLGYSVKGGANYNIDDTNNVFVNIGYFSKAPFLDGNVFQSDSSTKFNEEALNEKVFSAELGYGVRGDKFSANVNVYYTTWIDKSLTGSVFDPDNQGERINYNIAGLDALHTGVEVDFVYKATDAITLTGMASLGNWNWKNDASGSLFDEGGQLIESINVYAKDLKVSDAAQTTFALGSKFKLMEKTSLYIDYNYAGDLYASYRITDRNDETNRSDSWELPAYGLFDMGLNHGFSFGQFDASLSARMNNVLNTEYISDARDGTGSTAQTAGVYYGAGRTFSLGLKINF